VAVVSCLWIGRPAPVQLVVVSAWHDEKGSATVMHHKTHCCVLCSDVAIACNCTKLTLP
jgi:hypothetical protein